VCSGFQLRDALKWSLCRLAVEREMNYFNSMEKIIVFVLVPIVTVAAIGPLLVKDCCASS
jgi:hypothetical protein